MFADDIKLYRVVRCYDNTISLQSDLKLLFKWCGNYFITLNLNKCQVLTFYRSLLNNLFNYNINGETLP